MELKNTRMDLFDLDEFIGESESYMISYFERLGWKHYQQFNDYKFTLINDALRIVLIVEVETNPDSSHFEVSKITILSEG